MPGTSRWLSFLCPPRHGQRAIAACSYRARAARAGATTSCLPHRLQQRLQLLERDRCDILVDYEAGLCSGTRVLVAAVSELVLDVIALELAIRPLARVVLVGPWG